MKAQIDTFINKENLKDLRDFFLSCMGPKGTLKCFSSSADYLTVTNTSDRLFKCLELDKDPCAHIIIESLKNLHSVGVNDGGLYCASLITDLIYTFRNEETKTDFDTVLQTIKEILESTKSPISLTNLNDLRKTTISILKSKKYLFSNESEMEKLSLDLIKVFLSSLPTSENSQYLSPIYVDTLDPPGRFTSNVENGILFPAPEIEFLNISSHFKNFGKVICINIMPKRSNG